MSRAKSWIGVGALALAIAACSRNPRPVAPAPAAADSAAARLRADSLAAAARRDSLAALARRDSLARAQSVADSLARAMAERARADSVRAQVLREPDTAAATLTPSGLDQARTATLAEPVYFELDRSDLAAEAQRRLDGKLAILRASPRLAIQIEGHCDERGPDEYNLALGNRRAAAVKRYLVEHGIDEARVSIISYGEERPADPGHTEESWARNRRAEFRVTRGGRS
jgi:peptidoglycan-associated lipoprotein